MYGAIPYTMVHSKRLTVAKRTTLYIEKLYRSNSKGANLIKNKNKIDKNREDDNK